MYSSFKFPLIVALCFMFASLMTACNKADKKNTTQSVAKVNGVEITMHQVNLMIKNAQNVTAENEVAVRQQLLDELINQQIIVEKATKESLDRSPEVIMAIEAAKKEILATAYLQKLVANSADVSSTEIKKYYTEHPGLFSKRRVYDLQDLGMEDNPELLPIIKAEVANQKSLLEISDFLKVKGIKFSESSYTRPAEQIPLNVLPALQNLNVGDTTVLSDNNTIHVVHIVNAKEEPIDLEKATPFIKSFFVNTMGKEIIDKKLKQFRQEAKLEYVGDIKPMPTETLTNVSKNVPALINDSNPSSVVTKKVEDKTTKDPSIEAGVAGLK